MTFQESRRAVTRGMMPSGISTATAGSFTPGLAYLLHKRLDVHEQIVAAAICHDRSKHILRGCVSARPKGCAYTDHQIVQ